jgi:NTP pyrophosphatase (non-canonical NTP hydrolase)
MDRIQHLLVCLMEECAEVQQAAAKALRFGLEDGYPDTDRTNYEDIEKELNDVIAVAEMLVFECAFREDFKSQSGRNEKKKKVEKWLEYSREKGTLK